MKDALKIGCGIVIGFVILGILATTLCGLCAVGTKETLERALATATPASKLGGESRLNPVPVGSPLRYGNQQLTVIGSRKTNALGYWKAAENKTYLVVTVALECLAAADATCHYGPIDFRIVGSKGKIYDSWFGPETESPLRSGEIFGGSSVRGDLVQEIDEDEGDLVLIWSAGLGISRYFVVE